jgi:hypothetical protein
MYVCVVNYLFMLSVVMLSDIMPSVMYAACCKLAIYAEFIMPSVVNAAYLKLAIYVECHNAECHLCRVSCMLRIVN